MFPGYMLIFHLGRKGEGEGWHMCSLSRFLGHARSCQSRGQTHITLWSSSGVFLFYFLFISQFSRVLPLLSLVLILAAGYWDRFLFMLHIHEMGNRLGFQKSTSIDPLELRRANFRLSMPCNT